MKKIFLFLIVGMGLLLVGCNKPTTKTDDIIITKYYESDNLFDNIIELYNPLEEAIDLTSYVIDIYSNGETMVNYSISLSGMLEPEEYFIIGNQDTEITTIIEKSDLLTTDLMFNGNDTIALSKNGKIVDILGMVGSSVTFAKDVTLVRKAHATQANSKFEPYDFIMYIPDQFQYLRNNDYPIYTDEQLLEGPKLSQDDINLPFVDPNNPNLGGGGAIQVELVRVADGDTATFRNPINNMEYKVRFNLIDTREVDGTVIAQEWGYPASNFTKNIMDNSTEFFIQSIKGAQLKDGYDRYLGYVWADGVLVNLLVVKAGMSTINYSFENVTEGDLSQQYMGIPFFSFVYNAHNRAEINGWGVHGETDPNWDYNAKRPTADKSYLPDPRNFDPAIDKAS